MILFNDRQWLVMSNHHQQRCVWNPRLNTNLDGVTSKTSKANIFSLFHSCKLPWKWKIHHFQPFTYKTWWFWTCFFVLRWRSVKTFACRVCSPLETRPTNVCFLSQKNMRSRYANTWFVFFLTVCFHGSTVAWANNMCLEHCRASLA